MTDSPVERRLSNRLLVLKFGTVFVFCALALGFWLFQVVQYTRYDEMAENNHQRTLSLRAPRGLIVDRDERVLVENRSAYKVSLVREQSRDLENTIGLLASVAGLDLLELRRKLDAHSAEPTYRPIVVIEDASLAQVAAITARRLDYELSAVTIEEVPTRQYQGGTMAAHLFGFVGQANDTQVGDDVVSGTVIGQSGVEGVYNDLLMGKRGTRRVIVNSLGREMGTLDEVPPTPGQRVQLTVDKDLQSAAEDGFVETGFLGSAVVLDPRTGEVLSLVSLPGFDPNDFAAGIDQATWAALNDNVVRPLQNRAIQGRYSPGSLFKIVVAAAALEEGLVEGDFEIPCTGSTVFSGNRFHCHLAGGHGLVTLRHAIEQSCNVYFYTLGNMLGVDKIYEYAEKLGLTGLTGIDLPNERQSLVPNTEWKFEATGESWYPGETISVSIGQGPVSLTPISLAVMVASVANGGTRVTPHVLKAIDDGDGWEPVPPPIMAANRSVLRQETISVLHDGLWMAVNTPQGTAQSARIEGRDVAGKTGTAQVVSNSGRLVAAESGIDVRDHGWFMFFAPKDNPQIAGVIFAEHGEHGYLVVPIGQHIIETFFAKQEGRPLPTLQFTPGLPEHDPDTVPIFASGTPAWAQMTMQD
jgi:penicillin-binding protein 2